MTQTVQLAGKLDLSAVAGLHETLMGAKGRDVICDLRDARHIGALCLQVLLSAAQTAKDTGQQFKVVGASPRVRGQIEIMGFNPDTLTKGTA